MRLGKTTLIHFSSQVVVSVAGFVATFAIVQLLGATQLGVYAVGVAVVLWANIPSAAVGDAVKQRISAGGDGDRYLIGGLALVALPALLVGGAILTVSGPVESYLLREAEELAVGVPLAPLLAGVVVANMLFTLLTDALQGEKRVAAAGAVTATERLLRTGLQVGLVLASVGLAALFVGHVLATLLGAGLALGLLGATRWSGSGPVIPTREHIGSLLEYSRYSWLGTIETRAFSWMDTIVLSLFVSRELIGIYEVSWSLASVLALVAVSVQNTLFPELSELAAEGDTDRIHHFLDEGLVFTGVFIIPGLFGAAVVGERVLKIYDPVFQQGLVVLLVLVLARGIAAYGRQLVSAINALDRPDVAFRISAAFIVVNLGLNLVLVFRFGWVGAAVATAVSATLILALGHVALTRLIGRPPVPYREIGIQIGASGLMAGGLLLAQPVVPGSHYATVALVLAGAAVYTGILVALSGRIREKAVGLTGTLG